MKDLKPNFNHPSFFKLFDTYSELVLYAKILEYIDDPTKFIHNMKSRTDLSNTLNMSEINIKILLRNMLANGVFKRGIRGTYYIRKDLIQ